ncbi:GAF domain-containing protein [Streptomyces sp. NPDC046821]|uniref:GAF domain-containing protein n=1 Tax=Streptomyces sp. NPDC046821 TaxID=3154702 RepID=UPI0033D4417A
MDCAHAARLLNGVRAATLSGQRPQLLPRPVIGESWGRMLRNGVDPDRDVRSGLLNLEEIEERRQASPLLDIMPVLREALVSVADEAHHIMVVCDADGRILWREGNAAVLHRADRLGAELGADWSEEAVGTNGVGTPLVARRPVQVFSAEHFVSAQHMWTCAGAPITDPRDGRLLGVVDVSGPLETMHPATLSLVGTVAQLAEARLRERHVAALERLRAVAAPLLARIGGRAVAVDVNGWTAAVIGMQPVDRIALPKSLSEQSETAEGRAWLPTLGAVTVSPLPGGWLLRLDGPDGEAESAGDTRVVIDVSRPRRWSVEVTDGSRSWSHELSPRHAELLYLLALHRGGRSASALAEDMFGDPTRTVTIRAEMSRVRRYLGCLLLHRPYRFREDAEVEVLLPEVAADLLPHSVAPGVLRSRVPAP